MRPPTPAGTRGRFRLIGLTGGIATGKSTVATMFRELGAHVIDADEVAREVVAPDTAALGEIAARFPGVVSPEGALDRSRLAGRVFKNSAEREALNQIVHPRIQERVAERCRELERAGERLALYDAALLIENRLHERLDGVILVAALPDQQFQRLVARGGLTPEEARQRIDAQLPLEEKRPHATWVVDTSGSLDATREQVGKLWALLKGGG